MTVTAEAAPAEPHTRTAPQSPPVPEALTPDALREAFSHFPQGVVLIGAHTDGAPQGLVASTFTVGVSLEPPLVSVAVQHSSSTWPLLRTAGQLGVSLLGSDQSAIVRQLAAKDRARRFEGIGTAVHPAGALTIADSPAALRTRLYDEVRAGDHDIVLLEVLGIEARAGASPLVFHRSAFKEVTAPLG